PRGRPSAPRRPASGSSRAWGPASSLCRRTRPARVRAAPRLSCRHDNPEVLRASEGDVRVEGDLLLQQLQPGEAPRELLERQRGFEPPERGADAEVDAAAERERAAGVLALGRG